MRKTYRLLLALGVVAGSLSSCSRSTYSFNNSASPYQGSQQVLAATPAPMSDTSAGALTEATLPVPRAAGRRAAHPQARSAAASLPVTETVNSTVIEQMPLRKLNRQTIRQALKKQLAAAPKEAGVTDKSQTTALILCILLGGIGVHQFYLGYTGRGILRIALALTAFLIIPALVNLVLYIMDIIKIANGTLKPRDGEYGQKFNK